MTTKKNKQTRVGAPRQSNKHGGAPCNYLVGVKERHGSAMGAPWESVMGEKLVSISNVGKTSTWGHHGGDMDSILTLRKKLPHGGHHGNAMS